MTEADSILAGERSRNRPDRIVNAFAPGYVIAESDETNNTMCIMTFTNAPGEGPPPHTHTVEDETFIVHEGVLEFYQDDRTFKGQPGDVIYLVRGKRHYFKVISGNPAKYTVVCVPGGFDRFFREAAVEFQRLQPDIDTLIGIGAKYGIQIEAPPAP
jgi:quercetin dioxygenase-like cupin family protein